MAAIYFDLTPTLLLRIRFLFLALFLYALLDGEECDSWQGERGPNPFYIIQH